MEDQANSGIPREQSNTKLKEIFARQEEQEEPESPGSPEVSAPEDLGSNEVSRDQLDSRKSRKKHLFSEQNYPVNSHKHTRFLTEEMIRKKKFTHELVLTEEELRGVSDEELRRKIKTMFVRDKPRFSEEIVRQCEGLMDKHGLGKSRGEKGNLLDEFYRFCEERLPHDERYKESVLFVSMFYYFLERKKLIG